MKLLIDIDDYQLGHCKRHVEEHYANRLEEAIANGTPIPDDATNEELLLALYKEEQLIDAIRLGTRDFLMYQPNSDKWVSWLDAPYKGGK